jgi:hypothetical protein
VVELRQLGFNGLYTSETDLDVIAIVRNCVNLASVGIPWTILRHGIAQDCAGILGVHKHLPLQSLELAAGVLERTKGPPGPGAGAHWGFRPQLPAIKSLPYVALFFAGMIIEPHIRSVHGDS